jgi:phosphate-selective porin OprO/OprP
MEWAMRCLVAALLLIPALAAASTPASPVATPAQVTAAIGGVTRLTFGQYDQTAQNRAAVGLADDGVTFRTARLWAKGTIGKGIAYQTEMDFAQPGRPSFQNVYLELQGWEAGNVRIGRWKQPFSLETQTSIRHLSFIERATLFTFVPFRRTGAGLLGMAKDGRTTWGLSAHRANDDQFGSDTGPGGGWGLSGRATHLFIDEDEGRTFLHGGIAYNQMDPALNVARFATAPELVVGTQVRGNTPSFADTGNLLVDRFHVYGLEAAAVLGPVSLQAEAALADVDRVGAPGLHFPSAYAFVSWFVTGESRRYNRQLGAFDQVRPHRPFNGFGPGWTEHGGAVELTARYSTIDLDDRDIAGNRLNDATLGVNWHLTSNSKVIVNHVWADVERRAGPAGSARALGAQFTYDF